MPLSCRPCVFQRRGTSSSVRTSQQTNHAILEWYEFHEQPLPAELLVMANRKVKVRRTVQAIGILPQRQSCDKFESVFDVNQLQSGIVLLPCQNHNDSFLRCTRYILHQCRILCQMMEPVHRRFGRRWCFVFHYQDNENVHTCVVAMTNCSLIHHILRIQSLATISCLRVLKE